MNEERILNAIAELSGKIEGRMSAFDERLEKVEKKHYVTAILAESLVKHQRKQAVYDTIRDCGYGRREALQLIDAAGRIARDHRHYSKPVRVNDEIRRAIVIFEKE